MLNITPSPNFIFWENGSSLQSSCSVAYTHTYIFIYFILSVEGCGANLWKVCRFIRIQLTLSLLLLHLSSTAHICSVIAVGLVLCSCDSWWMLLLLFHIYISSHFLPPLCCWSYNKVDFKKIKNYQSTYVVSFSGDSVNLMHRTFKWTLTVICVLNIHVWVVTRTSSWFEGGILPRQYFQMSEAQCDFSVVNIITNKRSATLNKGVNHQYIVTPGMWAQVFDVCSITAKHVYWLLGIDNSHSYDSIHSPLSMVLNQNM